MDTSKVAYTSPEFSDGQLADDTRREVAGKISVGDWEKMVRALYAYRLGTIGFLDLLARWEGALGIKPPQANEKYLYTSSRLCRGTAVSCGTLTRVES